jgi:hypothetical protein
MLIFLYIFLGLLLFDCLVACFIYFRKERPFKGHLSPVEKPKTVKSTKHSKAA